MRALRTFSVPPHLPEALAPLRELAVNLRWAWDDRTRELYRWIVPEVWEASRHDPLAFLATVAPDALERAAADPAFVRHLGAVRDDLARYLAEDRWFQSRGAELGTVAYFSPEFGIAEALPQYSGGLGILAGDHLKSASDLGVPLVGIGLFYRHGYFRQGLSLAGWQEERFPDQDPDALPLTREEGVRVQVELGAQVLHAQVWRADVGRIPLYLLDADVDENPDDLRKVTDRLYGGDVEHRLRQEILLGIGGVRALEALGIEAQVFHTNEGHAGFLGLERIRRAVVDQGASFEQAVEATRAASIFTTHTPVPAGIDRFPRALIETYFSWWADACGVSIDQLMALGCRPSDEAAEPDDPRFNMAVMGLHLAGRSNAVSALHGEVSRSMFQELWPALEVDEVPITSVTNGVHAGTWVSTQMSALLARFVQPGWDEAGPERWAGVWDAPDEDLWQVQDHARSRLVSFVRERSHQRAPGGSGGPGSYADDLLDPSVLTIGFARRFATYKRANLLLAQPERLTALLLSADRPVQFVFAGKAHPADDAGKAMIGEIVAFARELGIRHRFVFLDDYDIQVARTMYQGCDVWLNTPRRPQEACGTSGMKAALNGTLNCSILDGWWDECFDGENGWAIPSAEGIDDLAARDRIEADRLFDLLEHQIVPLFYDRSVPVDGVGALPHGWLHRVKANLVSLGPAIVSSRMVRDYVTELYEPTAAAGAALRADDLAGARALADWKGRVRSGWGDVKVVDVAVDAVPTSLGDNLDLTVSLAVTDPITPEDLEVQVLHGRADGDGDLVDPLIARLAPVDGSPGTYRGSVAASAWPTFGFTVRVVPTSTLLPNPLELGLVTYP